MPQLIIDNYINQTFWVLIWFVIISLYTKQYIIPYKLERSYIKNKFNK